MANPLTPQQEREYTDHLAIQINEALNKYVPVRSAQQGLANVDIVAERMVAVIKDDPKPMENYVLRIDPDNPDWEKHEGHLHARWNNTGRNAAVGTASSAYSQAYCAAQGFPFGVIFDILKTVKKNKPAKPFFLNV